MQDIWEPLAQRLQAVLSLRFESQLRLFAPARVPNPTPMPHCAASADSAPQAVQDAMGNAGGPAEDSGAGERQQSTRTVLAQEDLPFFVELDAWSLGFGRTRSGHVRPLAPDPHLIPENVLNFVAYVPARWRQPMTIATAAGGRELLGFCTPGWGAVGLINAGTAAAGAVPVEAQANYMGLALQQLRQLIGLPDCLPLAEQRDIATTIVPPGQQAVALWEVDSLLRLRYAELASDTAEAVVKLLGLVCPCSCVASAVPLLAHAHQNQSAVV
jgi:Phosphatidylinositol-glycan biosynthesis class S protein